MWKQNEVERIFSADAFVLVRKGSRASLVFVTDFKQEWMNEWKNLNRKVTGLPVNSSRPSTASPDSRVQSGSASVTIPSPFLFPNRKGILSSKAHVWETASVSNGCEEMKHHSTILNVTSIRLMRLYRAQLISNGKFSPELTFPWGQIFVLVFLKMVIVSSFHLQILNGFTKKGIFWVHMQF